MWLDQCKESDVSKEAEKSSLALGVGKHVRTGLKENKEPGEDVYTKEGECAGKKCSEIS